MLLGTMLFPLQLLSTGFERIPLPLQLLHLVMHLVPLALRMFQRPINVFHQLHGMPSSIAGNERRICSTQGAPAPILALHPGDHMGTVVCTEKLEALQLVLHQHTALEQVVVHEGVLEGVGVLGVFYVQLGQEGGEAMQLPEVRGWVGKWCVDGGEMVCT